MISNNILLHVNIEIVSLIVSYVAYLALQKKSYFPQQLVTGKKV